MNFGRALEATVGRRLVFRVLLYGISLLGSILITVAAVDRFVVRPRMQSGGAPSLTRMLVENALALGDDPEKSLAMLKEIRDRGHVGISVYRADDTLIDTGERLLPPVSAAAKHELASSPNHTTRSPCDGFPCDVVGAFGEDQKLAMYAVIAAPPPPGAFRHDAAVYFGVVFLFLAIISIPVARTIARPLEKLGALSRELGEGNLSIRADATRLDEVGDLARAFNDMAERVQKLRHAEKELLANISHELRTPLARMRVVLELAADSDPAKVQGYLGEISEDLTELEQLIEDVITSARLGVIEGKTVDPYASLRRGHVDIGTMVLAVAKRFRERHGRTIVCKIPDASIGVLADTIMIRRVLENLVDNARKYSPEDRPIIIEVESVRDRETVRVSVIDEGAGISSEDLPHVFTSFFRADRSRTRNSGGVGLGLSLARRIVEAHGGKIELTSEIGHGTRIWFDLGVEPATAD